MGHYKVSFSATESSIRASLRIPHALGSASIRYQSHQELNAYFEVFLHRTQQRGHWSSSSNWPSYLEKHNMERVLYVARSSRPTKSSIVLEVALSRSNLEELLWGAYLLKCQTNSIRVDYKKRFLDDIEWDEFRSTFQREAMKGGVPFTQKGDFTYTPE
jgi:hypothetical protein